MSPSPFAFLLLAALAAQDPPAQPAAPSADRATAERAPRAPAAPVDLAIESPFPVEGAPSPVVHRYRGAEGGRGFAGLLLVSGWASGGGWFHRLAGELAARGGIEVWVLERRECFLEDRSILERAEPTAAGAGAAPPPVRPAPIAGGEAILRELSLASLCRDVASALERMRAEGAATASLGGWSATGPLLASFAAWDAGAGRSGIELVDGLVAFDSDLRWDLREEGEHLAQRLERELPWDPVLASELVELERAARDGSLARQLDARTGASDFADLYQIAVGEDCSAERLLEVYLGPGRPHEWFFPLRYHADTFQLHARDLVWKERGFPGTGGRTRPAFVVLSRALLGGADAPEKLPGIAWFSREIAGGRAELVAVPELGHAGILIADAAVTRVYDPLEAWLRALAPAARAGAGH